MKNVGSLVFVLSCSCALATQPEQRTLTFDERVSAQEAIERVYYGHQLGATKTFPEAVSRAVLDSKVHRYLDETVALQTYWKTAVTDETLQRELERMVSGTRMPDRLTELFDALGNDAFLIKECLVRPALVDRLAHNFYALDPRMHVEERALAEDIHRKLASGVLDPSIDHPSRTATELIVSETEGGQASSELQAERMVNLEEYQKRRSELPINVAEASGIKENRDNFEIVVLLSESATRLRFASYVVKKTSWDVWWKTARLRTNGDSVAAVAASATGGLEVLTRLNGRSLGRRVPCTDGGWDNRSVDDPPDGRLRHTAVWTGTQMVVWGGTAEGTLSSNTGSRYDPVTDTWSSMSTTNAPSLRMFHTAVWTGRVMVVWGGTYYGVSLPPVNTGGRYDPATDTWEAVTTKDAPVARTLHTAVWTGSSMVIWGGASGTTNMDSGGLYDPVTDRWTTTSTIGAPSPRSGHSAVWTGSRLIIWGGNEYAPTGGSYDPTTDTWIPTSTIRAPEGRSAHSAVWTGHFMVIWGGVRRVVENSPQGPYVHLDPLDTGARYNPSTDQWSTTSTVNAPTPRSEHTAIWTGSAMLVWGGTASGGGRYDATTDTWSPMSTVGAPETYYQSSVWTGHLLLAWGGVYSVAPSLPSPLGGRYDPTSDTWTPTSTGYRGGSKAVWTGNAMITVLFGSRYDPVVDTWAAIAEAGEPSASTDFTAIWTGSAVVVWGGRLAYPNYTNAGGRYDPVADIWTPTSTVGAPSPRSRHTAVWTGSSMLVWGGDNDPNGNRYGRLDDGARYDPATDAWFPIAATGAPSARCAHTAVWTGSEMVVWGGTNQASYNDRVYLNTGGRYDPETNAWIATSTSDAPLGRSDHTAVLIGGTMVVWGGTANYPVVAGGRYDPVSDRWTPTSTIGAPVGRTRHGWVSTGSRMIVWGGVVSCCGGPPITGGWYDPAVDRWTKIPTTGQPADLYSASAVWTGDAMIVWGGRRGGRYVLGTSLDTDCDGDGVSALTGDCDDTNGAVYPGAPQLCDGLNDDCLESQWPVVQTYGVNNESDSDHDGFLVCGGDCDDAKSWVYPGAPQLCDGFNNDCRDPLWPNVPSNDADVDRDGVRSCAGDCDDTLGSVGPQFYERCDGLDNDCDGVVDNHAESLCGPPTECSYQVCGGFERCVTIFTTSPCDDGWPCTVNDSCSEGRCNGTPTPGAPCDDSNGCTADDACSSYGYCGGTPRMGAVCDDENECTYDDKCGYDGRCGGQRVDDNEPCDDGALCTIGDACFQGYCEHGAGRRCNDDNACNNPDACDPSSGECVSSEQSPDCDDDDVCTVDYCEPSVGCVHDPAPGACDDGDACTVGDTCVAGECLWGPVARCDDTNPCTDDTCDVGAGCIFIANTNACDDGSACTRADACAAGACVGRDPIVCNTLDPCHDAGVCAPATGVCSNPEKPNGATCDDGNAETTGDNCHDGLCAGSSCNVAPRPKSAGYYRKLCSGGHGHPQAYDALTDADAACIGGSTLTFAGLATVDDICDVIDSGHHHGPSGDGPSGKECDKGEDELMAVALNVCRSRICTAQEVDSSCNGEPHDHTLTTVALSLSAVDAILADPSRNKDSCKQARCLAKEINNGHGLHHTSLLLAKEGGGKVRLRWDSPVMDDGTGAASSYTIWRRSMSFGSAFVQLGTTSGLTFVDDNVGAAPWEYEVTFTIEP